VTAGDALCVFGDFCDEYTARAVAVAVEVTSGAAKSTQIAPSWSTTAERRIATVKP
jgi:hypothetical protein